MQYFKRLSLLIFCFLLLLPAYSLARSEYCNIGSPPPGSIDTRTTCTNCSSLLSGDAGKVDCLVRHQGDHVNFGACKPEECSNIASSTSQPIEVTLNKPQNNYSRICTKIPEDGAVSFPLGAWHVDPGRNSWIVDPGEEIRNDGKENGQVKFFSITKKARWATPGWSVSDNYCFYHYLARSLTCTKIAPGQSHMFPKGAWHVDPGRNSWIVDPGEEIRNDGKENGQVKFFSITKKARWATPDWSVSDNYCFYQYQ
jgi:hypothetical protein